MYCIDHEGFVVGVWTYLGLENSAAMVLIADDDRVFFVNAGTWLQYLSTFALLRARLGP
jgi:hypothetical protein